MIIKSNLASKPTRNYSLYFLGCLLLAIITVGFTTYNITSLISSIEKTGTLHDKIAEQQKLRSQAQRESASLRGRIAAIKTPEFVNETEFLNNAIKRRVFSWTTLFDQFEAIFPNNVRMTSVTPVIAGKDINIKMEVTAKELNNIVELIKVIQNEPVFSNVVLKSEKQEQDGSLQATISLEYKPELAGDSSGKQNAEAQEASNQSGEKKL